MTVAEASEAGGVPQRTVRRWLQRGTLDGAQFNGRWWASAADGDRLGRVRCAE